MDCENELSFIFPEPSVAIYPSTIHLYTIFIKFTFPLHIFIQFLPKHVAITICIDNKKNNFNFD